MKSLFRKYSLIIILCFAFILLISHHPAAEEYSEVPAVIHIHTNLKAYPSSLDQIIENVETEDFEIFFLSDSYNLRMEYGVLPFRNLLKKKIEASTIISSNGIEFYLKRLKEINSNSPDMLLIPGVEVIPFYYWTGSPFSKNLTTHNWGKTFLILALDRTEEFTTLPVIHNNFSTRHVLDFLPGTILFLIAALLSLVLIKSKGLIRVSGILLFILSVLFLINSHPFRPTLFDQYSGDQKIAPYQEVINDVNNKGGLIYWSQHKKNKSDTNTGPLNIKDGFNPKDLLLSKNYTGLVITSDEYSLTEPGREWDEVLKEYCQKKRERPVWQIGGINLDKNTVEKVYSTQTVLFLKYKDQGSVISALKKGRTYTHFLDDKTALSLNLFSVSNPKTDKHGIVGEEISLEDTPVINISVSAEKVNSHEIKVDLIRSGEIVSTFKGLPPLNITYKDTYFQKGERVYYRLDISGESYSRIITNPIFVNFRSAKRGTGKW
jgi:hypothetical protein